MSTPTITVVFQHTVSLGVDSSALVDALQKYIDEQLAPQWAVHANLVMSGPSIPKGAWALCFADDSDQAGALGYHELEGLVPCGFVFVRSAASAGVSVSETASHELAELLLDPAANLAALSPRGHLVAREICDPVQGPTITVNGLPMADFVLPSWYGAGSAPYDLTGACQQPWEVLPGGYVPVWDGLTWTQLFGSHDAKLAFQKRGGGDPLRRTERRSRPPHDHDGESRLRL